MSKSISITTLGCKLNQAESDELKKDLKKQGFLIVSPGKKEDIAIIRACAVTCGASRTTRELIRSAKKNGAMVIAIGCLENKDLPEIDFIAKNNQDVVEYLRFACHPELVSGSSPSRQLSKVKILKQVQHDSIVRRTRAFIKIQTGCIYHCAYCIIPKFRGKPQSIPVKKIIAKIKEAEKAGYLEVILTGVNISLYRDKKHDLADLLKTILKQTNIQRIRLGSLDPRLITDKLIDIYSMSSPRPEGVPLGKPAKSLDGRGSRKLEMDSRFRGNDIINPRLLPHWHLSLQSAADKILKKMNRNYTAEYYQKIVNKLRLNNPLFSVTTDIIVGFPGETEKDFEESVKFIKKINFTKVHVFPFSVRPGTLAEKMTDNVLDRAKTDRAKKMREVAKKIGVNFSKKIIGLNRSVLFESKKGKFWYGYSPEYIRIKYESVKNLKNKIIKIKITPKNLSD